MTFEGRIAGGADIDGDSITYMLTDGVKLESGEYETATVIKTEYGSFIINPETGEYTYTVDNFKAYAYFEAHEDAQDPDRYDQRRGGGPARGAVRNGQGNSDLHQPA